MTDLQDYHEYKAGMQGVGIWRGGETKVRQVTGKGREREQE